MERKVIIFLLLLFIGATRVFSQDYIATDSSLTAGINLRASSITDNCHFIKAKSKGDKDITYTPKELQEYGLKGGTIYVSKSIIINGKEQRVFLLRLVEDITSLYYYSSRELRTYYLEGKDSGLVELSKKHSPDYRSVLNEYMKECSSMKDKIKLVQYSKSQLARLCSMYNTCSDKPFPYPKFGILVGYGQNGVFVGANYSGTISQPDWSSNTNGFALGLSFENPINSSNFSIYSNLLFTKSSYSSNTKDSNMETDILLNFTSVDIPVLVRYTLPVRKFRPFFNTGGVFSYNANSTSKLYQATINENVIVINSVDAHTLMSDFYLGYSVGGGVQRNLNYKNTISLEFRYSKTYGGTDYLNKNQLVMLTSFTF